MGKVREIYHKKLSKMLFDNFLGGIAWGLGATVGLAVVLTLFGFILRNINFVPLIGDFMLQVTEYIQTPPREINSGS